MMRRADSIPAGSDLCGGGFFSLLKGRDMPPWSMEEWMDEYRKVCRRHNWTDAAIQTLNVEDFRQFWVKGESPESAYREEMRAGV